MENNMTAVTFDKNKNEWIVNDLNQFASGNLINLMSYGQPYSPYQAGFNHTIYENYNPTVPPVVRFNNSQVMLAIDNMLQYENIAAVQKFNSSLGLQNGTYTFNDLVSMGKMTGGEKGDHRVATNIYGGLVGGILELDHNKLEKIYMFGSVILELQSNSKFIVENGKYRIEANLGLVSNSEREDNFDFNSGTAGINLINAALVAIENPANDTKVIFRYTQDGISKTFSTENNKFQVIPVDNFKDSSPCFASSTPILTPRGEVLIQDLAVGDSVLAFDGFNELVPSKVVNLQRKTTDTWVELSVGDKTIKATTANDNISIFTHKKIA